MTKLTSLATQSRCVLTPRRGRDQAMKYPTSGFLICFLFLIGFLLAGNQVQAGPKAGDMLVVDPNFGSRTGALFLVKRKTGRRTLLSDFGNPAQGPLGSSLGSVAVGPSGQIYVSDLFAGEPSFGGALFEIDPDTGNRTLVSNFGAGDPQGVLYYGLAVQSDGQILSNASRGDGVPGLVVRVRPDTDERTVVTDLADPDQGVTVRVR